MKKIANILMMVVLLAGCRQGIVGGQDVERPDEGGQMTEREVVDIRFVLGNVNDNENDNDNVDRQGAWRIGYKNDVGGGMHLVWSVKDSMSVYIEDRDGDIRHAGVVRNEGTYTDEHGARVFAGHALKKGDSEKYVFVHPYRASGQDISWTSQTGKLNNTEHLDDLLPVVWREDGIDANGVLRPTKEGYVLRPTKEGYVLRLKMLFKENPGQITRVRVETMQRGSDGMAKDRIFPRAFKMANLGKAVNSTLDAKTEGTDLGDTDYTDALTLTVTGGEVAKNADGLYEAEAYLAGGAVKNLNVFSTKYHVAVETSAGTYTLSDYRSLRGQQIANRTNGLPMLGNDTVFTLTATYSKGACNTVINDQYGVYSLLGMWNEFGRAFDPQGLIVYAGGEAPLTPGAVPSQLADNKAAILSRYQNNGVGTPTFLGYGAGSVYNVTASAISDTKQDNVTINNIEITRPTEVYVTFISEYGWNENLLGYYHYTGAAPSDSAVMSMRKTLIFPNVSKPNHQPFNLGGTGAGSKTTPANIGTPDDAPLREFETVKLLYTDENGFVSPIFPAGTTIGFMMMIDTKANADSPKKGFDLLNWGQWRLFTNTAWNAMNTKAKGANADWPVGGYPQSNYFTSADVCRGAEAVPGLAIYGVKDNGTNKLNTAYGAMIFMVSTGDAAAMATHNRAAFNIGSGSLVMGE